MKWLALIVLILAAVPFLWLRGGVFQEPLSTIVAAAKMEWSGADSADLGGATLIRAGTERAVLAAREAEGWTVGEQLGSGYPLERNGETIMLVCRNWSGRYRICA